MSHVSSEPLSDAEVARYQADGFLFPRRVLSDQQIAELRQALDDHLFGRFASKKFELTDPIRYRRVTDERGIITFEYEDESDTEPHTFPFLFNLWKSDERFARVCMNPVIAGLAQRLLGADELLLMEDNVVIKTARAGSLPWHQDYAYWPIAEPRAITVWIALDDITAPNGAMQMVPGSHRWGERLPVSFGDARPFMHEDRPGVAEVPRDPAAEGYTIATYALKAGECGLHSAMVWHGSTPNTTRAIRRAFVIRYVVRGTVWLGRARFPYDDIGCPVGAPLSSAHFPAVSSILEK